MKILQIRSQRSDSRNWKLEIRKNLISSFPIPQVISSFPIPRLGMFLLILSLFLVPCTLFPNFIGMNWGARAYSLGNTFVGLADDPSSIFWNPAGITKIDKYSFSFSHQNLFGIDDLYNEMFAAVLPFKFSPIGLGWTQVNLLGEYSEQVIYLSSGRSFWINKIPIRIGVSAKHYFVNVKGYKNADSPSNFDLDSGILIQTTKKIAVGFTVKNITRPKFKFMDLKNSIYRKYSIGCCYTWKNSLNLLFDYVWDKNSEEFHLGGEMWFYEVFAPRIGYCNENLTAGFGIKTKRWNLDGTVYADDALGNTYRISLGFQFGKKKKEEIKEEPEEKEWYEKYPWVKEDKWNDLKRKIYKKNPLWFR